METIFLSDEEVRMLTRRTRYRLQAEALDQMGVTYKVRIDGSILILRSHIENLLGAQTSRSESAHPPLHRAVHGDAIDAVNERIARFRSQRNP